MKDTFIIAPSIVLFLVHLAYGEMNPLVDVQLYRKMCGHDTRSCVSVTNSFTNATYAQARKICHARNLYLPKKHEMDRFFIETKTPVWIYSASEDDLCYAYRDKLYNEKCTSEHSGLCLNHTVVHLREYEVLCRNGTIISKGEICGKSSCTRNEFTCPDNSCVDKENKNSCVKFDGESTTPETNSSSAKTSSSTVVPSQDNKWASPRTSPSFTKRPSTTIAPPGGKEKDEML